MAGITQNWQNYGNLLFHPLNAGVNAANRFFYFSTLLDSSYNRNNNPEYSKKASEIGNSAIAALSSGLPTPDNDNEWDMKYQQIINFLEQSIIYEQKNEQTYFQQKLAAFENNFTAEERAISPELNAIYNLLNAQNPEEGFDYLAFITQLNILMQGFENTKEIFKFEETRLSDLEARLNNIRKQRRNQLEGFFRNYSDKESRINEAMRHFEQERISTYIDKKNISSLRGFKTNFKGFKGTASVEVAHWITDILQRIMNSKNFLNMAVKKIAETGLVGDIEQVEQQIKPILIKTIMTYATKNMNEILSGRIYDKKTSQILNELEDDLELALDIRIEGYYDNFAQFGTHVDFFKNGLEDLLNETEDESKHSAGLERLVEKLIHDANKTFYDKKRRNESEYVLRILGKGKKGAKNIPNLVAQLKYFENQIKKIEDFVAKQKSFGKTNFSPKDYEAKLGSSTVTIHLDDKGDLSFKQTGKGSGIKKGKNNFIDTLFVNGTRATSPRSFIQSSRKQLSGIIEKQLKTELKQREGKEQQELYKILEKVVQNLTISVGGPTFEEIRLGFQNGIISQKNSIFTWDGKLNLKNDTFEIVATIPDNNLDKEFQEYQNADLKQLMIQMQEQIQKEKEKRMEALSQGLHKQIQQFSKDKQFNEYRKYGEQTKKLYEEITKNDEQTEKELDKLWEYFLFTHKQYAEDQHLAELIAKKKQEFLGSLKDSLLVSATMKTLNTYQNDIGFIGGSLGSNIIHQVDHLNQLFQAAGMPMSEDEQNWLIFALINTSPASVIGDSNKSLIENYLGAIAAFAMFDEGAVELEMIQQQINVSNSPNILHIYGLNGIYFPGSYILTQVLDSVKIMSNLISEQKVNKEIHNGIIITNDTNFNMVPNQGAKAPEDRRPWQTVSKKAIAATNVNIVFMAGLLAIVEQLNNCMNNITIPV